MKRLLHLIFTLLISTSSHCQSYRHNIGTSFMAAFQAASGANVSVFDMRGTAGMRYMAGLKWPVNKRIDFVASADPCIFIIPFNGLNGFDVLGSLDVPIDLKFYFGGIDKTSFFAGMGVDFFSVLWSSESFVEMSSFGPQVCLGFNHMWGKMGIGARVSYTYGLIEQPLINSDVSTNLGTISVFMSLPSPGMLKPEE